MGKNGKLLNLNSDSPKYGNKSLVTKEQENELDNKFLRHINNNGDNLSK